MHDHASEQPRSNSNKNAKFEEISPKETEEIAEKRRKMPWQQSSDGKQQHKCDCENVINLAGEFQEHKSQGKKLSFLKHFSPI